MAGSRAEKSKQQKDDKMSKRDYITDHKYKLQKWNKIKELEGKKLTLEQQEALNEAR